MPGERQAEPHRAEMKRCYCGRTEPHEDVYHSWRMPSRAEIAEAELARVRADRDEMTRVAGEASRAKVQALERAEAAEARTSDVVTEIVAWMHSEANRIAGHGQLSDTVAGALVGAAGNLKRTFADPVRPARREGQFAFERRMHGPPDRTADVVAEIVDVDALADLIAGQHLRPEGVSPRTMAQEIAEWLSDTDVVAEIVALIRSYANVHMTRALADLIEHKYIHAEKHGEESSA